jgi:hypothetical protein
VSDEPFVPADFTAPAELIAAEFRLVPLGPQHNVADYAAWTGSIDHIRATPGFADGNWPHDMPLTENARDLERHAHDFAARRGFTYTVLDTGTGDVIGCLYIYPARGPAARATPGQRRAVVKSWVRADCAALDPVLYAAVRGWLDRDWPFDAIDYASRG